MRFLKEVVRISVYYSFVNLYTPCVAWSPAPALASDCRGFCPQQTELGQPSSALNNIHVD